MKKRSTRAVLSAALMLAMALWTRAAQSATLAQLIEGAKKEGNLTLTMRSGVTPRSIERLVREISKKYGVDLKMNLSPTGDMRKDMSQAVMEDKVGTTPTYDLMYIMDMLVPVGMKAEIFERVDWMPLISKETNPRMVLEHPVLRGAIAYHTAHIGLMYNSEKVKVSEVPKTLNEVANPKWKGKVGIFSYEQTWARWYFILGKEKVLSDLKAILKNGAIRGRYVDLQQRFLLGEISLVFTSSNYLKEALDKDMPAAWQSLDFADIREEVLVVRKGAKNSNAAKLVAAYLASPDGAKFMLEESGTGNLFYPGNHEHDIAAQAKKAGLTVYALSTSPGLLDFHTSDTCTQWEKEIRLIFDTTQ